MTHAHLKHCFRTILKRSTFHIGRGVALHAQAAVLVYINVRHPQIAQMITHLTQIFRNNRHLNGLSPSLSYARVLIDESPAKLSRESLYEESSSASSVPGRLPVKAEKSITRPIYTRWRSFAKVDVPYFRYHYSRMPMSSALKVSFRRAWRLTSWSSCICSLRY